MDKIIPIAITNIDMLKMFADDTHEIGGDLDIFIRLNGCRSSKSISYHRSNDSWWLHNEIDDSTDDYKSTAEFEKEYPLFFKAMATNNLFKY